MKFGFIVVCVLGVVALFFIIRNYKQLKLQNVMLVSGGVKTGKSFLSVWLVKKTYKKVVVGWYIRCGIISFINLFKKNKLVKPLKPMLYSNIPLANTKFNRLTIDIVLRKVRIPNKSVVLLDEVSLLADSMMYKDKLINDQLMLFVKLWGHYSHNGYLFINTQSIQDCHFAFKRCISSYLWIHSKTRLPFISIFKVRELMYSEDNSNVNVNVGDVEETLKTVIVFNKIAKMYDYCCYSIFTDNLIYDVDYDIEPLGRRDSLKAKNIVSLRKLFSEVHVDES